MIKFIKYGIGMLLIIFGLIVTVSWLLGYDFYTTFHITEVSMKFNTSVSLILFGITWILIIDDNIELPTWKLAIVTGLNTMVLFLIVSSYFLRIVSIIDNSEATVVWDGKTPSSFGTTLGFLILITVSFLIAFRRDDKYVLARVLIYSLMFLSIIGLIGHFLNVSILFWYIKNISSGVAPNTLTIFVIISIILRHHINRLLHARF
jgi:hypothetical protein